MKIEMAEQMMQSFLQNVECCQVTQTNWTPIIIQKDLSKFDYAKKFIEEVNKKTSINVLKKSGIDQFIKQCEIDVIGIRIDNNNVEKVFLVDTAFHRDGLNYKDVELKVLQKFARQVIISYLFFNSVSAKVIFATPKLNNKLLNKINSNLVILKSIVKSYFPKIEIELLYGNEFANCIDLLLTTIAQYKKNDDNDLFIRSVLLLKTAGFELDLKKSITKNTKTKKFGNKKIIFDHFNDLVRSSVLTQTIIDNLKDKIFSKTTFKMPSFPILIDDNDKTYDKKRFYSETLTVNGVKYKVCSQWIPERIKCFEDWVASLNINNDN